MLPSPAADDKVCVFGAMKRSTIRSTWITPAPDSSGLVGVAGMVRFCSSAFTWSLVRLGRASSNSAAAPDTTAAACEDPLPLNSVSLTYPSGCS